MDFTTWDAGIHGRDPNALCHYGVSGMRWGVRRFQNTDGSLTALGEKRYGANGKRGAMGRSRDLNKLDYEAVDAAAKAKRLRERAEVRYSRQDYRNKKRNPKAVTKKDDKTKRLEEKARAYEKLSNRAKNMSERIIKNTLKNKMSVRSRDTLRSVEQGRNFAKSMGLSLLLPVFYATSTYAKGTQYRVKNDGKGQRLHRKTNAGRYAGRTSFVGGWYSN